MPKKDNFIYNVLPIDVDGDDVPDGNLITKSKKQKNGKVVVISRKFVPFNTLDERIQEFKEKKGSDYINDKPIKVMKDNKIQDEMQNDPKEPIYVADKTSLGQSVKTGLGFGFGSSIGSTLGSEIIGSFFN